MMVFNKSILALTFLIVVLNRNSCKKLTDRQQGPRILTFFLYLNDVEEGGGTKFNDLDIVVKPKKGKALVWPSVVDKNLNEKDFKTHHEAMKVEKGVKYGANAWIHLRDYQTPMRTGCS